MTPLRFTSSPLSLDQAAVERFLAHCQRRRYPNRTDVFRPGDPAGTLYYVVNGSVSIIAEEEDGREGESHAVPPRSSLLRRRRIRSP